MRSGVHFVKAAINALLPDLLPLSNNIEVFILCCGKMGFIFLLLQHQKFGSQLACYSHPYSRWRENSYNKPQMKAKIKGVEAAAEALSSDNTVLICALQVFS